MRDDMLSAVRRTTPLTVRASAVAFTLTLASCATGAGSGSAPVSAPVPAATPGSRGVNSGNVSHPLNPAADARWADSVLATLSLRDKAAQMVWVWTLGDFTAVDAPA